MPPTLLHLLCVALIILVLSIFILVQGELVPKRMSMQQPEKTAFALRSGSAVRFLDFRPFWGILNLTANGIVRNFGVNPSEEPHTVTEEEIRMMVDVGNEKGTIEKSDGNDQQHLRVRRPNRGRRDDPPHRTGRGGGVLPRERCPGDGH
jgi:putative hemolysin